MNVSVGDCHMITDFDRRKGKYDKNKRLGAACIRHTGGSIVIFVFDPY